MPTRPAIWRETGNGRPRWYDAQWNDDEHHAFHILLTGERDGYYEDYAQRPLWHLGRCLAEGFAYQGERSLHRSNSARGEPSAHLPPTAFVPFLQNHDQVGNRAFGERLCSLASEQALRAATTVLLLAPAPPLLFMGEEFGAATPFLFFCDFGPQLAAAVTAGRRREFARFARFSDAQAQAQIPDPNDVHTFESSKLDWALSGRRRRTIVGSPSTVNCCWSDASKSGRAWPASRATQAPSRRSPTRL